MIKAKKDWHCVEFWIHKIEDVGDGMALKAAVTKEESQLNETMHAPQTKLTTWRQKSRYPTQPFRLLEVTKGELNGMNVVGEDTPEDES